MGITTSTTHTCLIPARTVSRPPHSTHAEINETSRLPGQFSSISYNRKKISKKFKVKSKTMWTLSLESFCQVQPKLHTMMLLHDSYRQHPPDTFVPINSTPGLHLPNAVRWSFWVRSKPHGLKPALTRCSCDDDDDHDDDDAFNSSIQAVTPSGRNCKMSYTNSSSSFSNFQL